MNDDFISSSMATGILCPIGDDGGGGGVGGGGAPSTVSIDRRDPITAAARTPLAPARTRYTDGEPLVGTEFSWRRSTSEAFVRSGVDARNGPSARPFLGTFAGDSRN